MADDRIFDEFPTALGQRVDPSPEFGGSLYTILAADLGFRPARAAARRTRSEWLARALGLDGVVPASPALRLARVATLGALLLAVLLAIVLVAGELLRSTTPNLSGDELVSRSQALYPNPPAFDMTVQYPGPDVVRFRYDGGELLRTDVIEGSMHFSPEGPGSYRIQDATEEAVFDKGHNTWQRSFLPAPRPALFSMAPLNWIAPTPWRPPATPPANACQSWERLGDGVVAGRPAYHVRCPEAPSNSEFAADFWIDQASLLAVGDGDIMATALTVDPVLDPSLFDFVMPVGATDLDHPPASTVLVVGRPAPDWTGPLQAGGTFDTRSLRGTPAAIYFWTDWCNCAEEGSLQTVSAAAAAHPGIHFVSVAWSTTSAAEVQAAIDASGYTGPMVRDDAVAQNALGADTPIADRWGITIIPALVLLRSDGTVAIVLSEFGPLDPAQLERELVALEAGEAIPVPSPTPASTPCNCEGLATPAPTP